MNRQTKALICSSATIACIIIVMAFVGVANVVGIARADSVAAKPGLALPKLSSTNGKALFISKACVVCHSVNDVGGSIGAPLDASEMDPTGNPFVFFAKLLMGATPMLELQRERLGHEVELSPQELGDIVMFLHDGAMQKTLTNKDIPRRIMRLMDQD